MSEKPLEIRVMSQKDGICDLHVQVAAAAVQATFDRVFHEAVARAQTDATVRAQWKIPDDRPVEPETVFAAWGERVHASMQQSLVDWALLVAKSELALAFVDQPLATVPLLEPGRPATLRLRCFPVPEIPASALEGFAFEWRAREPSAEEVTATLHRMRRAVAGAREAPDRAARRGDRLVVNLRAELDGGASILDQVLVDLDPAHEPAELVEHLTGARAGSDVAFALADGTAVEARVDAVLEVELPSIDEELARRYGLDGTDQLETFARESVRERIAAAEDERVLAAATDRVCERTEVPVPETLARRRYALELRRALVDRVRLGRERPELDPERIESAFRRTRPAVEELERRALVVAGLVRALGIELADDEVHAWVRARAVRFGFGAGEVRVRPEQLGVLRRRMLQQRLVEAIRS